MVKRHLIVSIHTPPSKPSFSDFTLTVWPKDNNFQSSILSMKYSILHKIAIANWLLRLHISSVSKDIVILLFLVGTSEPFDMGK